jgi:glycosyltransferase involved in cell wall biosynthesis
MRLLFPHHNFVTGAETGNSRSLYLLSELISQGWLVDVICPTRTYLGETVSGRSACERSADGRLAIYRVPSRAAPSIEDRARSYVDFARDAARLARRLPRPDVVLATSPPLPQVTVALMIAASAGAPIVLEVRDLWPVFLTEAGLIRSRALRAALEWLETTAYRSATEVIAASPAFIPYLDRMGVSRDRGTVIPTGADPYFANADAESGARWRASLGFEDELLVLYAGSFNAMYPIESIVEAARASSSLLPGVTFVLAGAGQKVRLVQAAAEELSNVRYLGALKRSNLRPVFSGCDVGLICVADWPMQETVLPGKVFDYFASSLPVISTINGVTGGMLDRISAGVVAGRGSTALIDAISHVASLSEGDRAAMGERGRAWALRHADAFDAGAKFAAILGRSAAHERGVRYLGLLDKAARALGDVAARRASRAVKLDYRCTRKEAVSRALDEWFEDVERTPQRRVVNRPQMPALLWGDRAPAP